MPKRPSKTRKKSKITVAKAHERAVKAWRTKHLKYRYGLANKIMPIKGMAYKSYEPPEDESGENPDQDNAVDRDADLNTGEPVEPKPTWEQTSQKRTERLRSNMEAKDVFDRGPEKEVGGPAFGVASVDQKRVTRFDTRTLDGTNRKPNVVDIHGNPLVQDVVVYEDTDYGPKPAPAWGDQQEKIRKMKHEEDIRANSSRLFKTKKGKDLEDYQKRQKAKRKPAGASLVPGRDWAEAQTKEIGQQLQYKRTGYQQGMLDKKVGPAELRSGRDRVIKTTEWELIDNTPENRYAADSLTFTVNKLPMKTEVGLDPDTNNYVTEGRDLRDTLAEAGIKGNAHLEKEIKDKDGKTVGWTYKVNRGEGNRINPAQAAKAALALQKEYGLRVNEDDLGRKNFDFTREGPAMRQKRVSLKPGEKPPAWVTPENVWEDSLVERKGGAQLGQRELKLDDFGNIQGYGALKKDEKDVLSIKGRLPRQQKSQRLQVGLGEETDAVGWGRSYRPGQTELNQIVFGGKRWNELADLGQIADLRATGHGDEAELRLEALARERHPDADSSEIKHWKEEMYAVGSAGVASAAYTARKKAANEGVHKVAKRLPFHAYDKWLGPGNDSWNLLPTIEHAYARPAGQKLDRALWRADPRHWLSDPLRPNVSPLEFNIMPEMPSIRYRTWGNKVPKEFNGLSTEGMSRAQYQRERRLDAHTVELAKARHRIREAIETDPAKMNRYNKAKRYAVLHSSEGVMTKSDEIGFDQRYPRVAANTGLETNPYVDRALLKKAKAPANPKLLEQGKYLKGAMKYGGRGALGLAAVGAGVIAYDEYKKHHPDSAGPSQLESKAHIPEVIKIPKLDVKVTKEYKIPDNNYADLLDVQGKKVPYAWKPYIKYDKVRLRNFKDISGEGYKSAPIVGNVKGAGVKQDGSWTNSVAYKQRSSAYSRGLMDDPTLAKNRYEVNVKGKKLPVDFYMSGKERWKDVPKKDKLSTSNPNKLTQDDREMIAMKILTGGPMAQDMRFTYGEDQKIMDMVNDPREMNRLEIKYNEVYADPNRNTRMIAVRDPDTGAFKYVPEFTRSGSINSEQAMNDRPMITNAFNMSPEEIKARQQAYYKESEADYTQAFNAANRTYEDGFYTAGTKRTTRKGGPELGKSDLESQRTERRLRSDEKQDRRFDEGHGR